MKHFARLLAFVSLSFADGRTSAPAGALIVGSGHYATVQAAVDALTSTSTQQSIFIMPGTYEEQVTINRLSVPLTIYGYTADTSSYSSNQVTITAAGNLLNASSDDATATIRVETPNFKMYNINVVNSFGKGSQALAVSANAANQGYYACSFKGYQDTLLAETGTQLYARCYIEGAIDFIFGQRASAWFENCTIGVLPINYGTITASGRTSADSDYYVINNSAIGAAPGQDVSSGVYYLGRSWGDYARVVVQETSMSDVINAAGWHVWSAGDENIDHVSFEEYGNSGAGAMGTRANYATKLGSALKIEQVLGSVYANQTYVDTSYL
ncbi:carbohydrate esterase family 8 protein [Dothistroma septosporum NZE10]|uniref:Pectinesterase n=1 Tax=Dothistroma septosporum (strain NZE10 / CBS 128990) TaxID=675120 RepID=N1PEX6_DOTSN|nr:carbohydrate esterase family 8 protein [Dothistroma septosporum NZE10]